MTTPSAPPPPLALAVPPGGPPDTVPPQVILSFDVEEHHRIEAAAGLDLDPALKAHYRGRLGPPTYWLLEQLERHGIRATFFVVGQIARDRPGAGPRHPPVPGTRWPATAGTTAGSTAMTPDSFREDVRRSRDALEQVTGEAGRRLPRPDLQHRAADGLGPRRAGRVGPALRLLDLPGAPRPLRRARRPRGPFLARGRRHEILELPPATLRLAGVNVPAGGGGYFRLLPLAAMERRPAAGPADLPARRGDALLPPLGVRPGQPAACRCGA